MADKQFNAITQGTIWKQLLIFMVPLFLQSVFQQVFGIVDAIIVGQGVGKVALGAINSTTNLMKLFLNLFQGFCSGTAILVGQAWGAKNSGQIQRSVHTGFAFSIVGALAVVAVCVPLTPLFMRLMQIPDDMLEASTTYTRVLFVGYIGVFLYDMAAGILRAIGDSKHPFYYLVFSFALNTLLDLLFVLVFHWGVMGVAVATALSHFVSAALAVGKLCRADNDAALQIKKIRFHAAEFRSNVRLGIPMAISGILYSISNIAIQSTVNSLGTDVIAGRGVVSNITSVVWIFYDAIGITVSTFVAQNYGARRFDRVHGSIRSTFAVSAAIILPLCLVIFIFVRPLAYLFNSDEAIIEAAVTVAHIEVPFLILYLFGEVFGASIRGCGETFRPMLITLIGTCGFRVLWVFAIHTLWSPTLFNVTLSYPTSWFFNSALVAAYFFFGKWRRRLSAPGTLSAEG